MGKHRLFNSKKKFISKDLEIYYSAINFEGGRQYFVSLSRNKDVLINGFSTITFYYSNDVDRKHWALLLSELRKELKDDL